MSRKYQIHAGRILVRPNDCHCNACGKTFGSLRLFDWHRTGTFTNTHPDYGRVCRGALHLALHGAICKDGSWIMPMSAENLALLRSTKA